MLIRIANTNTIVNTDHIESIDIAHDNAEHCTIGTSSGSSFRVKVTALEALRAINESLSDPTPDSEGMRLAKKFLAYDARSMAHDGAWEELQAMSRAIVEGKELRPAEDWTCVCGNDIPGRIPICLCGRFRDNQERN